MAEDTKRAAEWLLDVLRNPGPTPPRPAWLEGAGVTVIDAKGSIPSVVVELTDGSRFSVAVMHTMRSPAQEEAVRRQAEAYYSSPEYAEFQGEMQRRYEESKLRIREAHAEKGHAGPFVSCGVESCRIARGATPWWWRNARVEEGGGDTDS